jgi:hypothetical protein
MKTQCPHCLGFATRPEQHRWFELPLALFLVQPYHCRRCAHRFLRFRWPDLSLLPTQRRSTLAR